MFGGFSSLGKEDLSCELQGLDSGTNPFQKGRLMQRSDLDSRQPESKEDHPTLDGVSCTKIREGVEHLLVLPCSITVMVRDSRMVWSYADYAWDEKRCLFSGNGILFHWLLCVLCGLFRSEISLPIMKELVPHYLQESGKTDISVIVNGITLSMPIPNVHCINTCGLFHVPYPWWIELSWYLLLMGGDRYPVDLIEERLDYLEDGKNIFKLRLRLCSSLYPVSERIRDFFLEYDRHTLRTSPPWGSELLEAINSLKNVDSTALLQFLYPILNMLLHLIGNGGETLQVAAFRATVNILTRVHQESVDEAERNAFLVNFVDYAFDDFGGHQTPVYPGLSTVWGSLARSKAKGYRVGPVYDDVLAMAWFFLELIVKSMALEQARSFYHNLPSGEDVPPMQLKEGVFRCVVQLYDCLLTEVHERCKKGLSLAKHLNSSLAFFCYDLLSIIEPHQVFELVSLYLDKFSGVCQTVLHDCKLTFLQIICDHDLFVEMPGRDPSDR
ncbi:hypothetical protein FXO38_28980 [Capsicum annuum]|nr:hypothetical protein FXO38_28980 [Capsicum annuum]KAF3646396.1 hypothetical protein FXO37_20477 [Capsicum annuum]